MKRISLATALIVMTASLSAGPADRFAGVEIKSQLVSGNVYMLEGAGGNIGASVGPDGTLIVDDQFEEMGEKIEAALTDLGGDRPRLVLNTHYHGDHTGANANFGRTGTIISHDNVRVRLVAGDMPRSGLPLVTYGDTATVHFNDNTIELLHLPTGHTDGDTAVWFKEANVIHLGDQFFNGRFPYIDTGAGGTVDGFIANIDRVLAETPDDIKIIPGHGPLATKADLKATIDVVKKTSAMIRAGLKSGTSAAALSEALERDYAEWGSGFINASRWVQIVESDS